MFKNKDLNFGKFSFLVMKRSRGIVVNITLCPLYSRAKTRANSLNRGLSGPHGQSGHFAEEKNIFPVRGFDPCPAQCTAYSLYRLHYPGPAKRNIYQN
jgi:hypothetical protein